MAKNSHLNIKDYVLDINRKREGSNRHFFTILQCKFLKLQPLATRQILGLSNFEADTFEKKRYGGPGTPGC